MTYRDDPKSYIEKQGDDARMRVAFKQYLESHEDELDRTDLGTLAEDDLFAVFKAGWRAKAVDV